MARQNHFAAYQPPKPLLQASLDLATLANKTGPGALFTIARSKVKILMIHRPGQDLIAKDEL